MKERNVEQKGPRRSEWLFTYKVQEIHKACEHKLKYHDSRILFWKSELKKAEKAVKSASVTTRSYPVTGGEDIQVILDPTLTGRLSTCNGKIREHQARKKEYEQWSEVLGTQVGSTVVDLSMEDALYFNMAGRKEDE